MEPLTTTALISAVTTYLGAKLKENESIDNFFNDFTEATVNWIKPLFLKDDGTEKEAIRKLKENPESEARNNMVKSILEVEIEDNPDSKSHLENMYQKITESGGMNIIASKNVNTGDVNTQGGDFRIGDGS